MINEVLHSAYDIIQWDIRLTVILALILSAASTYLITYLRSAVAIRSSGDEKSPPLAPYTIPGLGNLIPFAFDTRAFLSSLVSKYGPNVPVRIRVLNMKIHFISGSESVLSMFKGSKDLTTAPASILVLENAFGSPASDRNVYERDDTGISREPLPGSSQLEPHNRIYYRQHQVLHRYLQGNALVDLADRFMKHLETELLALDVGQENWTELPDFYELIQTVVFKASTSAICGPHLFRLNPDFTADFWKFDTYLPGMFKNLPRWMIPNSYKMRDKLLACILKWHKYAREHVDAADPKLKDLEWEEFWGARIMREREIQAATTDGFSDEAAVASDLGMIWASNANIVPIIGWEILDILFRQELLQQVQAEIENCSDRTKTGGAALDMPKLVQSPLLQSIYSEELRLRNGVIIQRVPVVDSFKIGPWKFPKGQMITASSWHEQRDRRVWNEGPVNGEFHSVDEFWAERFLMYQNDPNTGPRKPNPDVKVKSQEKTSDGKPKFTAVPVTGSFIPFGGGEHLCPGRFYAKQEALGALAMILTMFEIELKDKEKPPQMNLEYFPFGVIPPIGRVPVKIRRRHA